MSSDTGSLVHGGLGAGILTVNGENDVAAYGDDIITLSFGGESGDILLGGSGRITCDESADRLVGGSGKDTLIGLGGNDRFGFDAGHTGTGANADVTLGFDRVGTVIGDIIDLADLTAATLAFRGTAAFSGINQVRGLDYGTSTEIAINLAGNAAIEAVILVNDGRSVAGDWRSADSSCSRPATIGG